MKKRIALLLALVMTVALAACAGSEDNGAPASEPPGEFTSVFDEASGTLTISGRGWMDGEARESWKAHEDEIVSVVIEEGAANVVEIAFDDCENLTSVTLPKGLTSIEESTFEYCESMTEISIPAGVVSVGDLAFYGCESLRTVRFGGSAEQWAAITVGKNNEALLNAEVIFGS